MILKKNIVFQEHGIELNLTNILSVWLYISKKRYMTTNCWYDMNIQEQTRQHNIDLEILHDIITLPKKLGLGRKFIL